MICYIRFIKLLSTILFAGTRDWSCVFEQCKCIFLKLCYRGYTWFFLYEWIWLRHYIFKHDFHSMLWTVILKGFLQWKNYVLIISIGGMLTERKTKFSLNNVSLIKIPAKTVQILIWLVMIKNWTISTTNRVFYDVLTTCWSSLFKTF